jgi:UDP:flavonoid glycosyltransferase YjiC (YdhE family)
MQISEHLVQRGFKIYFITGPGFKVSIERMGAEFVENPWAWEPVLAQAPPVYDHPWLLKHLFGDSTLDSHRVLKATLERVRKEHPDREVVILHESLSGGLGPFAYGAPLPEGYSSLPKSINFHTSVYATKDANFPPFGPGLPYDPTPENLALWRSVYDAMEPSLSSIIEHYNALYKPLGATRPITAGFLDFLLTLGDVTVLATTQSLDYPIPNKPSTLRLIGGLPLQPVDPAFAFPAWWSTITANAALPPNSPDKKKVVFVTQGTVHRDYTELIIPTLQALANQPNLLVVATLGARRAKLHDSTVAIPDNTIVVDYFPYNALLAYTDVFVSNAGYGGFMQGVMNGVPMVLAGVVADKAEVCARAEYAGVAVNLRAQKPGKEAIALAVETVLREGGGNKRRAVELREENERMDALRGIEGVIEELVGGM